MAADYARLTVALTKAGRDVVTYPWHEFDEIVDGLPASATKHYPQWWHGDRPNTRAWRKAGYELASVEVGRSVTFRRAAAKAEPEPTPRSPAPSASRPASLTGLDPRSALIVIGCSKRKARGGHPAGTEGEQDYWSNDLMGARKRLLARSAVDPRYVLPAWRRYTGTFYRTAGTVVGEAVEHGRVVILSGGYGIVRGDEPISWYERKLRLGDWPSGLLEAELLAHARRLRALTVVAFVSRSGDYFTLLRRTPWREAGIQPYLVTIGDVHGGAQVEVPKRLAQAFSAFWRLSGQYPPEVRVER